MVPLLKGGVVERTLDHRISIQISYVLLKDGLLWPAGSRW